MHTERMVNIFFSSRMNVNSKEPPMPYSQYYTGQESSADPTKRSTTNILTLDDTPYEPITETVEPLPRSFSRNAPSRGKGLSSQSFNYSKLVKIPELKTERSEEGKQTT